MPVIECTICDYYVGDYLFMVKFVLSLMRECCNEGKLPCWLPDITLLLCYLFGIDICLFSIVISWFWAPNIINSVILLRLNLMSWLLIFIQPLRNYVIASIVIETCLSLYLCLSIDDFIETNPPCKLFLIYFCIHFGLSNRLACISCGVSCCRICTNITSWLLLIRYEVILFLFFSNI